MKLLKRIAKVLLAPLVILISIIQVIWYVIIELMTGSTDQWDHELWIESLLNW